MRAFRPKVLTVGGVEYEVHLDRTVYRRIVRKSPVKDKDGYVDQRVQVRRVKDRAEIERVLAALAGAMRAAAVRGDEVERRAAAAVAKANAALSSWPEPHLP